MENALIKKKNNMEVNQVDLDQVIKDTQNCVRTLAKIDIEDKYNEYSIDRLMTEIKSEAVKLDDNITFVRPDQPIIIEVKDNIISNKRIRQIDEKLQRSRVYSRVRKVCHKIYRKISPQRTIDAKQLLKYDNEQFVKALYRSLLKREVDEEALINCCNSIKYDRSYRIDLIYAVMNSQEGKNTGIKVANIRLKYYLYKLRRRVLSTPIIGYLLRIIFGIMMLPKRINSLQKSIIDVASNIHYIEKRVETDVNHRLDYIEKTLNEKFSSVSESSINIFNEIEDLVVQIKKLSMIEEERKVLEEKIKKDQILEEQYKKKILDLFYLRYNEELMVDSRELVMERAEVYLREIEKYLGNKDKKILKMIDLGCGEGEFIELLNKNGYPAYGVDSNSAVVSKMKEEQPMLKIVEDSAINYLKKMEKNSLDFISAIHMVEHLEFFDLIVLLKECFRVLKDDGLLILETPNPQNILISTYYFNLDPTHKKPIPPELLKFFVEESGLQVENVLLIRPLNFCDYNYEKDNHLRDIVFRFNMEQAYSIVAVKKS